METSLPRGCFQGVVMNISWGVNGSGGVDTAAPRVPANWPTLSGRQFPTDWRQMVRNGPVVTGRATAHSWHFATVETDEATYIEWLQFPSPAWSKRYPKP